MPERAHQLISLHDVVGLPLIIVTIIAIVYMIKHRDHLPLTETLSAYVLAVSTLVIASREISVPLMLTGIAIALPSVIWLLLGLRFLIHEYDSDNSLFFTLRIGVVIFLVAVPTIVVKLDIAGPAFAVAALVSLALTAASYVKLERGQLIADHPTALIMTPPVITVAFAACWLLIGLTLGPSLAITAPSLLWLGFAILVMARTRTKAKQAA